MTDNQQRPRAATMFERTVHDVAEEQGGRWKGNKEVHIVGTQPQWQPPRIGGTSPWAVPDGVPTEPPTGERVDWLPSMETISGMDRAEALAIDAANAAPTDTQPTEDDA
jgi:hypothetical protein